MNITDPTGWSIQSRTDDRRNKKYQLTATAHFSVRLDEDESNVATGCDRTLHISRCASAELREQILESAIEIIGEDAGAESMRVWFWASEHAYGCDSGELSWCMYVAASFERPSLIWTAERLGELLPIPVMNQTVRKLIEERIKESREDIASKDLLNHARQARRHIIRTVADPIERQLKIAERLENMREELETEIASYMVSRRAELSEQLVRGGFHPDAIELALDGIETHALYATWPATHRGPGITSHEVTMEQLEAHLAAKIEVPGE